MLANVSLFFINDLLIGSIEIQLIPDKVKLWISSIDYLKSNGTQFNLDAFISIDFNEAGKRINYDVKSKLND